MNMSFEYLTVHTPNLVSWLRTCLSLMNTVRGSVASAIIPKDFLMIITWVLRLILILIVIDEHKGDAMFI